MYSQWWGLHTGGFLSVPWFTWNRGLTRHMTTFLLKHLFVPNLVWLLWGTHYLRLTLHLIVFLWIKGVNTVKGFFPSWIGRVPGSAFSYGAAQGLPSSDCWHKAHVLLLALSSLSDPGFLRGLLWPSIDSSKNTLCCIPYLIRTKPHGSKLGLPPKRPWSSSSLHSAKFGSSSNYRRQHSVQSLG